MSQIGHRFTSIQHIGSNIISNYESGFMVSTVNASENLFKFGNYVLIAIVTSHVPKFFHNWEPKLMLQSIKVFAACKFHILVK